MKAILACLCISLLLWNCKKNEVVLTSEPITISGEECGNCPKVAIKIPQFLDKTAIANIINSSLKEEVISLIIYDDEIEATNIEQAISSFKNGYLELKELYPDEPVGWESNIEAKVTYEDKNILSIKLDSYSYTGGAHGFSSTRFLNFDKVKEIELDAMELFRDPLEFEGFVESKFREQEKIPATETINATGFMFEDNQFYLPWNIGFTKEGLQLYYEQYEVTSYAEGPYTLQLPYAEVKPYLNIEIEI